MSNLLHHRSSVLVLYRTLLRHLTYLPSPYNEQALNVIRKEFKSQRKAHVRKLVKSCLVEAYQYEKQLFQYHKGETELVPIVEIILKYERLYKDRETTIPVTVKPTIRESYPERSPEWHLKLQKEQRLERLINKLVKSDQAKTVIPRKSELDQDYIRHIYGTKVINMKASQEFHKLLQKFGPSSKPYELKYKYNTTEQIPLLSLVTPKGTFHEFDKNIYNELSVYTRYQEDMDSLELYQEEYLPWLEMEDKWDKLTNSQTLNLSYVLSIRDCKRTLRQSHTERVESQVKFHNRKVMFMKSKLKLQFQQYHDLKQLNFNEMISFIKENSIDEYNDYANSLAKVLIDFKFTEMGDSFDYSEFESKLDPKEFNWELDN